MELRLDIGPLCLGDEWILQPRMFHHFACAQADADAEVDSAKARIAIVDAEVELDIRGNPGAYGLTKDTEAAIKAAVLASPQHKAAVKAHIEARRKAGYADGAVQGLHHRKAALENMVRLLGQDYHAAPRDYSHGRAMDETEKRELRGMVVRPRRDDDEE